MATKSAANGNEVTQKLRTDIRKKLLEIGAFIDNELCDYIMVMIANHKTRYQMKDDLSLFLGKDTDHFVDWLHDLLKNMKLSVAEDRKDAKSSERSSGGRSRRSSERKDRSGKVGASLDEKASEAKAVAKSSRSDAVVSSCDAADTNNNAGNNAGSREEEVLKLSDEGDREGDELLQEQRTAAADDDMARSVVLKKPVQLGDDLSGHSSRDDQSSRSQPGAQPRTQLRSQEGSQRTQPTRSRESEVSQNRIRQRIQAPSSTIGATFLKRKRESEDEEELPRPAVSSVVRVRQRKSSVPAAMQANKLLLLKAVKDTVGDSDGSMASRPPRRKGRSPSESQGPSETRGDFRVTKKVSRDEEMESEHEDVVKTIEDDDKGFKRAAEDDSDYTPTPIKRRLGERNVEEVHRFPAQLLQPEDLRHHLSKASDDDDEELEKGDREQPRFVVTLDGVDHDKFLKSRDRDLKSREDQDDLLLLDEEMDEELVENDVPEEGGANVENEAVEGRRPERCRFWPACKNQKCPFLHPSKNCTAFPNCHFGDKCLYLHPRCRFDAKCTRKDCPYKHASRRPVRVAPSVAPGLAKCKFFPNCVNPGCPFQHPKPCHFGIKCRSATCPFAHPPNRFTGRSMPAPNQMKWSSKHHISERPFAKTDAEMSGVGGLEPI